MNFDPGSWFGVYGGDVDLLVAGVGAVGLVLLRRRMNHKPAAAPAQAEGLGSRSAAPSTMKGDGGPKDLFELLPAITRDFDSAALGRRIRVTYAAESYVVVDLPDGGADAVASSMPAAAALPEAGRQQSMIGPASLKVESYCVTCKAKRTVVDPVPTTMRNGRAAAKGKCGVCGTVLYRMGALPAGPGPSSIPQSRRAPGSVIAPDERRLA